MKTIKILLLIGVSVSSSMAWAYGSSSSQKACKKPVFSKFAPAHLSAVNPASEFSFKISSATDPGSLVVSAKKMPIEVTIEPDSPGHKVTGQLPATLSKTYARIQIAAKSIRGCPGSDGWLLQITE